MLGESFIYRSRSIPTEAAPRRPTPAFQIKQKDIEGMVRGSVRDERERTSYCQVQVNKAETRRMPPK